MPQCQAITQKELQCSRQAKIGTFCPQHHGAKAAVVPIHKIPSPPKAVPIKIDPTSVRKMLEVLYPEPVEYKPLLNIPKMAKPVREVRLLPKINDDVVDYISHLMNTHLDFNKINLKGLSQYMVDAKWDPTLARHALGNVGRSHIIVLKPQQSEEVTSVIDYIMAEIIELVGVLVIDYTKHRVRNITQLDINKVIANDDAFKHIFPIGV